MHFLTEAQQLQDWMIQQRRWFHRHPENHNREVMTSGHIAAVLDEMGLKVSHMLETAVVADLVGGKPGPTVAFRADMDALPILEATGREFASENIGMMHACGHDFHMAGALGAARLLAAHRKELPGTVRFLFQPDEEMDGGAQRMIAAGCLEGVSQVYGCHVRQELPVGKIGICPGPFYAATNPFKIILRGKSAHGAEPHNGIDTIVAGAQLVLAIQTILSRRLSPMENGVITVGSFHGGSANNVIAGETVLEGMIRTFGDENRQFVVDSLQSVVEGIAQTFQVEAQVEIRWGYPSVINHAAQTRLVELSAQKVLGLEGTVADRPRMVAEDFGYFLRQRPGCFYHIGVGGPASLHSDHFDPEEWTLCHAAAVHAQVLWDALNA